MWRVWELSQGQQGNMQVIRLKHYSSTRVKVKDWTNRNGITSWRGNRLQSDKVPFLAIKLLRNKRRKIHKRKDSIIHNATGDKADCHCWGSDLHTATATSFTLVVTESDNCCDKLFTRSSFQLSDCCGNSVTINVKAPGWWRVAKSLGGGGQAAWVWMS